MFSIHLNDILMAETIKKALSKRCIATDCLVNVYLIIFLAIIPYLTVFPSTKNECITITL